MESLIEKLVKNNVKKFYFTSVMSKEHEMNIVISLSKEDYEMLTKPNSRNERIEMLLSKQEQDCKNKVKMTKSEYTILKSVKSYNQWIARDRNGSLNIYPFKPKKETDEWIGGYSHLSAFGHMFQFIQWEDSEPYNIKDLLDSCEVCDG